jgi:catechol 2,3-dioxygenase-like lactoylglutathione lyase family enzyme
MSAHSRVNSITPLFVVSNLQRSVSFYRDKLGFADPTIWGEPPCFAMLNRDGFELMLSLAEKPGQVLPHGPAGIWDLYIKVADLDAEAAALRAAGVALAREPAETVYAMREMECLDPDGHRICFGQELG